jgi:hypothetical protein
VELDETNRKAREAAVEAGKREEEANRRARDEQAARRIAEKKARDAEAHIADEKRRSDERQAAADKEREHERLIAYGVAGTLALVLGLTLILLFARHNSQGVKNTATERGTEPQLSSPPPQKGETQQTHSPPPRMTTHQINFTSLREEKRQTSSPPPREENQQTDSPPPREARMTFSPDNRSTAGKTAHLHPHALARSGSQSVVRVVVMLAATIFVICLIGAAADPFFLLGALLLLAGMAIITPALVAFWKNHPNRYVILWLNCFFFTGATWVIALIWALKKVHISENLTGSDGGESGLNLFVNDETKVRHTVGVQTDIASQLSALKALLDNGALSELEYEAAKKRVIGGVARH